MKKEKGVLGMSVKALVFTLILFSVSAVSLFAQSELEGTWTHYINFDSRAATWVFSGNNFTYKQGDVVIVQGTFTTTTSRNTTNLSLTGTNGETLTAAYTVKDGVFSIPRQPTTRNWPAGLWYGSFNKVISQNNFDGTWKHLHRDAKEATFVFTGNGFTYTRNDNVNISGTTQRVGNKIFLIVDGNTVCEYVVVFYENEGGSAMTLFGCFGNWGIFYQGSFSKQ